VLVLLVARTCSSGSKQAVIIAADPTQHSFGQLQSELEQHSKTANLCQRYADFFPLCSLCSVRQAPHSVPRNFFLSCNGEKSFSPIVNVDAHPDHQRKSNHC